MPVNIAQIPRVTIVLSEPPDSELCQFLNASRRAFRGPRLSARPIRRFGANDYQLIHDARQKRGGIHMRSGFDQHAQNISARELAKDCANIDAACPTPRLKNFRPGLY